MVPSDSTMSSQSDVYQAASRATGNTAKTSTSRSLKGRVRGKWNLLTSESDIFDQLEDIKLELERIKPRRILHNQRETDLYVPDLSIILEALRDSNFDDTKWMNLGLTLGLFITTLRVIENDHRMDTSRCLLDTMDKWLRRADNVSNEGNPSWDTLSDALHKINEHASADYIFEHKMTYAENSITINSKSRDEALFDVVKDANQLLLDQNKRQIEGLLEKFKQISFKRLGDTSRYHLMDEIKNEMQMLNTTNEKLKDNVDKLNKLKDTLQEAHLAKELMSYELEKAKSSYDAILRESNSKTKQVEELKNSLENITQKFDEKCILSAQLESLLNEKDEQLIVLKETNGNLKLEIDELKSHFNLKNEYTFYAVLVKHILKLLNNRDLVYLDNDLLRGKPYQDVIAKRLHQATNEILSFINQYLNLDHIIQINNSKPSILQQLWINLFENEKICHFDYGSCGEQFACQFPFFWLIKDLFESQWETAKATGGSDQYAVHQQLCYILNDTPIASVLVKIPESHHIELYQCYLRDFLKSVHNISHYRAYDEHEIIARAIDAIVTGPDIVHSASTTSFVSLLAAVHVVYHNYQREIMWFGQLSTYIPGILGHLSNVEYDPQCMRLQLQAVEVAIANQLKIPLDKDIPSKLILAKLHLCQNTVDSILSLPSSSDPIGEKIRCSWQHVRGIQLFVEHVVMKLTIDGEKYADFVKYVRRIELIKDFTQVKTINNVQKVLRAIDIDLRYKKWNYLGETQKRIHSYCTSYFMEVVSSLCFGSVTPPEPPLIKELLNVIFTEKDETKEFSYSDKVQTDKVPVIRSFLLRLLLEHNIDAVREHMEEYFMRSRQLIKDDRNLFLLCIQCFEDVLYKKYYKEPLNKRVKMSHQLLGDGMNVIMKNDIPSNEENATVSLEYLEGIAKIRYSMTVVCELIHYQHTKQDGEFFTPDAYRLLDLAKRCCEVNDARVDSNETGLAVFLVKQMARQYGIAFITDVISDKMMEWIIPKHLRPSEHEPQTNDVFVIYPSYQAVRSCLTDAVCSEDLSQLQEKAVTADDSVPLILGVYQVVTGSRVHTDETKFITEEIRKGIDSFVKNCKILKRELMWIGQHLIEDTYCGRLEPMTLRPGMSSKNRILTDLVIHIVVTIQNQSRLDILNPFVKMINSPGELKNLYLPTMPGGYLPMTRAALTGSGMHGAFYECPQGHPYFVSECGRPVVNWMCPECGSKIGGINNVLESSNRIARTDDTTETGYALGPPSQRENFATAERDLNPPSCAIVRAIMHGCLLWASCTDEYVMDGLLSLIKSQVQSHEVSQFFWHHLEQDVNILSRAIGKSTDEACLIIHLILKEITTTTTTGTGGVGTLQSKDDRKNWEKSFSIAYIQPILNNLNGKLQDAVNLQLNDKKDHDRLLYAIHEKVSVGPKAILPHLWTYRSRITLEHLSHALQTKQSTYPILDKFLKQEPLLNATRFIPEIVKLQHQIFELSHKKLDKSEITIEKFIHENIPKGLHFQSRKDSFIEKLNCVRSAWKLVKDKLKEQSRVRVDPEYIRVVTWDESTPLSFIIPTLTGPGACTVALIDLLVGVHNDFIEKCHSQLKKTEENMQWEMIKVPLNQIQHCHLLDYEQHLMPMVLSHCQYSLEYGKGQNVTYDYPALEKNIIDRFIYGKPLIQLEIPKITVKYRKDVITAQVFANIRKHISPQVKLTIEEKNEILTELYSIQSLKECLDVVEIVIGFLSTGSFNSSTVLIKYIDKVLKMKDKFTSKKATEYCTLGHILSLWETISVQIAKLLTLRGQKPFDSLGYDFHANLHEIQLRNLAIWLREKESPPLINILCEFIETRVRHVELHCSEWPLKDTLVAHLGTCGLDDDSLPVGFEDTFPSDITVGQTIATWKAIVTI